jgi:hypothetical protein
MLADGFRKLQQRPLFFMFGSSSSKNIFEIQAYMAKLEQYV